MLPLLLSFCFLCCLLFVHYGFWLAFFTVWMVLGVDRLVLHVASWTYAMERNVDCHDKKGAS
jgi:ABC-type transport system involved in Fe-S cluster assembly fused permease/ATPase subunit